MHLFHTRQVLRTTIPLLAAAFFLTACTNSLPTSTPLPTVQTHTLAAITSATPTPSATATQAGSCSKTQGTLQEALLPAPMLKYPLKVKIYLPPCYTADKALRFPVLYMLHGMSDSNEQWVRLGMAEIADRLISSKIIEPLIIVMPNEDNWQLTPEQSGFGNAIIDVLIPWVESNFAACTGRACRAIGGLSRGGNWAVKIGFENWSKFIAVGAHSTPLFYGEILRISEAVKAMPTVSDAPAVYVDVGKKDENLNAVLDFEKALTDLHIAHDYHLNSGYHDESYWGSQVENYLLWYASQLEK